MLGLALPSVVAAPANNTVVQDLLPTPKKTTASDPQENRPIDLPAVIGQDIKGITIPQYDATGHLSMQFTAETARKIDEHQVELDKLTIEFFEKSGKGITVTMPHGIFDLATKTLSSSTSSLSSNTNVSTVSVKREDFDVVGQSATFDTAKRFGTMQGHVHTEIRNGAPADEL